MRSHMFVIVLGFTSLCLWVCCGGFQRSPCAIKQHPKLLKSCQDKRNPISYLVPLGTDCKPGVEASTWMVPRVSMIFFSACPTWRNKSLAEKKTAFSVCRLLENHTSIYFWSNGLDNFSVITDLIIWSHVFESYYGRIVFLNKLLINYPRTRLQTVWGRTSAKVRRQEIPNSLGGRKSMYPIQAPVAMKQ